MMDSEIEARVQERNQARKTGDYAAADRIREELRGLPERVEIQDFSFGTRWYKTRLSIEERQAILARYPKVESP